MLNMILFGPPGAGKGTQAQILVERFNFLHLSTGEMLRSEIESKTDLGLEAKRYMDKGELVPDETVIGMICSKTHALKEVAGVIYDGFPRTINQAEALEDILSPRKETINALLSLEVPHEELVKRLLKRGQTSGRSDDARQSTIENRIRIYHEKTRPLKDHYAKQNKLIAVNGLGTIEEIADRLNEQVNKLAT